MIAGVERNVSRGHAASSTLLRLSTEGVYRVNDTDSGPLVLTVKGASKATTPRTVSVYARECDDSDVSSSIPSSSCVLLHAPMLNLSQSFSVTLPVFTRFVEVVFNGHISPGCALPRHEVHIVLRHQQQGGGGGSSSRYSSTASPSPSQGAPAGASWAPSPLPQTASSPARPGAAASWYQPGASGGAVAAYLGVDFREAAWSSADADASSRDCDASPPPAVAYQTPPQLREQQQPQQRRRAVPCPPPVSTPMPPPSLPWDARAATTTFGSSNRDPQGMWVVAGDGTPAARCAAYETTCEASPSSRGPRSAPTPLGHGGEPPSERLATSAAAPFSSSSWAAFRQTPGDPATGIAEAQPACLDDLDALRREVYQLEAQAVALETRAVEEGQQQQPVVASRADEAQLPTSVSRDDVTAAVHAALASERNAHQLAMAGIAAEASRLLKRLRRYPLETPPPPPPQQVSNIDAPAAR